jgi:hypothetical protein
VVWAPSFGDASLDVGADGASVLVAGFFGGTLSFGPGAPALTALDPEDIMVSARPAGAKDERSGIVARPLLAHREKVSERLHISGKRSMLPSTTPTASTMREGDPRSAHHRAASPISRTARGAR